MNANRRLSWASIAYLAFALMPVMPAQAAPRSFRYFGPTDMDNDGLLDVDERRIGTNPLHPDTDDDGLLDGEEVIRYGSDPLLPDTDSDTLSDYGEAILYHTNPRLADSDGDGLLDPDEVNLHGSDPRSVDGDADGLADPDEIAMATNPRAPDTDGDGLLDGREVHETGTNPLAADSDADGVFDGDEVDTHGTDPLDADTDGDGLLDGDEIARGTDPLLTDSDGDALADGDEVVLHGTDPTQADTDGDGLNDGAEIALGTDPLDMDSDNDGLLDGDELSLYGSDPTLLDTDADGLSDYEEVTRHGTDPADNDTDGDGILDGEEIIHGFDPTTAGDDTADADADGLNNLDEVTRGTDPNDFDSDHDGAGDGLEVTAGTDPLDEDTDGDGLNDGAEFAAGCDPLDTDSDNDGVLDGDELVPPTDTDADGVIDALDTDSDDDGLTDGDEVTTHGTDPALADTDGDGIPDGVEVSWLLNPLDAADGLLDPDSDNLDNATEYRLGTDPLVDDTDLDLMEDGVEVGLGLNPVDAADAAGDLDGDGLTNVIEVNGPTDPANADTDGDGIGDGEETIAGFDGHVTDPVDEDSDDDTISDGEEVAPGVDGFVTDPNNSDTDGDGLDDDVEIAAGLDPTDTDTDNDGWDDGDETDWNVDTDSDTLINALDVDSDNDGLTDGEEITPGTDGFITDPLNDDTDGDGLTDGDESLRGTNPLLTDTDGDGLDDGEEVAIGSDPLDTDTDNDGIPDGLDPDPLDPDADNDLIIDGSELVDGFNGQIFDATLDPGPWVFLPPPLGQLFRVVVFAESTGAGPTPAIELRIDLDGDTIADSVSVHAVRDEGGRFFSSPVFSSVASPVEVEVVEPAPGNGWVQVTQVMLAYVAGEGVGAPTIAGEADTDQDGIADGMENATNAFWLEAEHYADPAVATAETAAAGNGILVEANVAGDRMFELVGPNWGYIPGIQYQVFLRGRIDPTYVTTSNLGLETNENGDFEAGILDPWTTNVGWNPTHPEPMLALDPISWDGSDALHISRAPDSDGSHAIVRQVVNITVSPATPIWLQAWVRVDSHNFGRYNDWNVYPANLWVEYKDALGGSYTLRRSFYTFTNGGHTPDSPPLAEQVTAGQWNFKLFDLSNLSPPIAEIVAVRAGSQGWSYDVTFDNVSIFVPPNGLEVDTGTGPFTRFVQFTDQMEWRYVGSYTPDPVFDIRFDALMDFPVSPFLLDRVAIVPMSFNSDISGSVSVDAVRAFVPDAFPGLPPGASVEMVPDLPWGISDPMEADTDGDGVRLDDGVLPGSAGWLVDGHELTTVGSNPFDIDSDHDADLFPLNVVRGIYLPNNILDDQFTIDPLNVCPLNFVAVADSAPDFTDNLDCNPISSDSDEDGILDLLEIGTFFCPPPHANCQFDDDRDDDGLSDGYEDRNLNGRWDPDELNANLPDTDLDGIPDGVELGLVNPWANDTLTPPFVADADNGTRRTNPRSTDSDGDTIPDSLEDLDGNGRYDPPLETDAARSDSDSDGLSDPDEIAGCTEPTNPDTDGDGLKDGEEVNNYGTNPCDNHSDNDNIPDGEEARGDNGYVTDPANPDTDGDGLRDDVEIAQGTNPTIADTDGDGLTDKEEVDAGTDPLDPDSDDDGVVDGDEGDSDCCSTNEACCDTGDTACCDEADLCCWYGDADGDGTINAEDEDSDGDGMSDGEEAAAGTSSVDDQDVPAFVDAGIVRVLIDETNTPTWAAAGTSITWGGPGRIMLGCVGGESTMAMDMAAGESVTLDRNGPTITGTGDVELLLPVAGAIPVWSGPTSFDFTTSPGTVLVTPNTGVINPFPFGLDDRIELDLDAGASFDLCAGQLDATGTMTLNGPPGGWSVVADSAIHLQPLSLAVSTEGIVGINTPFGSVELDGSFGVSLTDIRAEGMAELIIPQLQDLAGAEVSLPEAEFLIDPTNGHFIFRVDAGASFQVGPATLGLDGIGFGFELDAKNGFLAVEGGFEIPPVGLEGTVIIDLSGQIAFVPEHLFTDNDCITGIDVSGLDGHYFLGGEASIPVPVAPVLFVTLGLDYLADVAPVALDGDGFFLGGNGSFGMGAGFGPVSLSVELGGATAVFSLDANNEVETILLSSESGLVLGDLISGLPDGLGVIGQDQAQLFTFDVATATLDGCGQWRYFGFVLDWGFTIAPPGIDQFGELILTQGGIDGDGTLELPLNIGEVEAAGTIGWDGQFQFSATSEIDLTLAGFQIAGSEATVDFDNSGVDIHADVSLLGSFAGLEGDGSLWFTPTGEVDFNLALSGDITLSGFDLAAINGNLTPDGMDFSASLTIPGAACADVSGYIKSASDFQFTGTTCLQFGDLQIANANIELSPTGVFVDGMLSIPGAGDVHVTGIIESNGHMLFTGVGTLSPLGYDMADAAVSFERLTGGVVTVEAFGELDLGNIAATSVMLTISTNGSMSGSGSLDVAGFDIDCSVSLPNGGSAAVAGSIGFSQSVSVGSVNGSVTVSLGGSGLSAGFSGSVRAYGFTKSYTVSISLSGCMDIAGVKYPCPKWNKPFRTCTKQIRVCL